MFCHFWQKFENSKWPPFLGRGKFFENCKEYTRQIPCGSKILPKSLYLARLRFVCLFGVLRRFQHCTGHITTGSWKGRGNQYIEFARVVYCKLPTNGKQLPAFPLKAVTGIEPPTSEVGGESVTTLPPWPPRTVKEIEANYSKVVLKIHNEVPKWLLLMY